MRCASAKKISLLGADRRHGTQREMTTEDLCSLLRFYDLDHWPQFEIGREEGDPLVMPLSWMTACQFPFQENCGSTVIGRSLHLFTHANCEFNIAEGFHVLAGLNGYGVQETLTSPRPEATRLFQFATSRIPLGPVPT
jgi:hypothetical protein